MALKACITDRGIEYVMPLASEDPELYEIAERVRHYLAFKRRKEEITQERWFRHYSDPKSAGKAMRDWRTA